MLFGSSWQQLCEVVVSGRRLKEATRRLVTAWVLASACLTGHLAHLWPNSPAWLHVMGRPSVHGVMSALALLGMSFIAALCILALQMAY